MLQPERAAIRETDVRLRVAGCELRAHVWDGGSAARVLLLHGLGGNSITWHAVAPALAATLQARVVAPDLPGFGASRPGSARLSFARLAHIVRDITLGNISEPQLVGAHVPHPPPWIVAGNSLGGSLALELARQAPASVANVTLAALALPYLWGRTRAELGALLRYLPGLLPGVGRRLVHRYVTRTGLPGVVDDPVRALFVNPAALRAELRQRLLDVSQYRLGWAADAARAYEQVALSLSVELLWPGRATRLLQAVRCPVLSISGSHDPLFPPAAWDRLKRVRPDWDYVELAQVGHVPQLEAPEPFVEHMLAWLGRLPVAEAAREHAGGSLASTGVAHGSVPPPTPEPGSA
jgi:pimeloyl-ACP methyl ester carboxylesterase